MRWRPSLLIKLAGLKTTDRIEYAPGEGRQHGPAENLDEVWKQYPMFEHGATGEESAGSMPSVPGGPTKVGAVPDMLPSVGGVEPPAPKKMKAQHRKSTIDMTFEANENRDQSSPGADEPPLLNPSA